MTAKIIDGKKVAQDILNDLSAKINSLKEKNLALPKLAAVLVGNNPGSEIYVKNKIKACEKVGILSEKYLLSAETAEDELLELINKLNFDNSVTAILVQLPLPEHIDKQKVIDAVSPSKDVDGFHPYNLGRLASRHPTIHPCTPKGIMRLIEHYNIETHGKHAVIVGSSVIVGRPIALELLMVNATVTICHSKTKNLAELTRQGDILISATGCAGLITAEHVKPGAAVFDIGISRDAKGLIHGDVESQDVSAVADYLTPVPGGVGPMTVAMLLTNCLELHQSQQDL